MNSARRYAESEDEREMILAAANEYVETLKMLLQRGVCPNVHDKVKGERQHSRGTDHKECERL